MIGRVARRIWARAMRDRYGAAPRSQMLKYHIQTSGRSLHAREIQFNDIRTTLQALYALFDNCNSLHTNAYDEALTTPTEESVRRAVAIQLIINRELGLNKIQNPWQGSFALEYLTDLVEEAVYRGVRGHQRARRRAGRDGDDVPARQDPGREPVLRDEEARRHAAHHRRQHLPVEGDAAQEHAGVALIRSTGQEKQDQVAAVRAFQQRNAARAPAALAALQRIAASGGNVFAALMDTVRCCSLGQISSALYHVGGQYRRSV